MLELKNINKLMGYIACLEDKIKRDKAAAIPARRLLINKNRLDQE
jgi:hypothetical protein